jgi:AcrR family transcriptional regulator
VKDRREGLTGRAAGAIKESEHSFFIHNRQGTQPMPKVTEAHLEARRSQILDAAWTCFALKGYHQATMQDICQESGLSPGAIYRYFESKEAILKAINERSQEMGRALVEEARSLVGGPLNTLEVIGQTMLSYFRDPMAETTTRINIEIWPEIIRNGSCKAEDTLAGVDGLLTRPWQG